MPPSPSALRRWRPALVALGVWLGFAAVAVLALWHLRAAALQAEQRELALVSLTAADAIERGLRGAEEGLQALGLELVQDGLPADAAAARVALQRRTGLMPWVQVLWVRHAAGRLIAASDASAAPDTLSFDPALEAISADQVAVSRPWSDPVHGRLVALAWRCRAPALGGSGWVLAALPTAGLLGAFGAALPGASTRLGVFRRDGVRLAGVNDATAPWADPAWVRRVASGPGRADGLLSRGQAQLLGVQALGRQGISVWVARDRSAALGPWRQTADLAAAALVVLGLVLAAAAYRIHRADRRRAEAQRALQAQLARSSKLESLGSLAGGVAHDFNNILAGIVGFGEMAQDAAAPGSAQRRHLDKLLQAAMRGQALVERILAFSRGGARVSTVFALEPVVEEVLSLLSASLCPGIVIERAWDAPGVRVRGDPTQAFEVVMNLCTNAMQAMPGGGMLSVRLVREQVGARRVLSHSLLEPGCWVALSVSDQGTGISAQVMEHLFEPFFTTRAAQSGSGLGLAVVFGVVAEWGGAIDVRSRVGEGARFCIYLPEASDAPGVAGPADGPARRGAGQAVLVLDDQPDLVAMLAETLAGLGYAPVGLSDPAQALRRLSDTPGAFAALVTDERMPGMTGTALTATLRERGLALPVLLVSGYGGASLAQRAREAGVDRVLAKPVQRAQLAHALGELLA